MNIYKLIEKLGKEGYSKKELSIVYFDAKINKKMKDEDITKEYLICNLPKVDDIKVKVDEDILLEHYDKRLDFISLEEGVLFIYEISRDKKYALGKNHNLETCKVPFDELIPFLVKPTLYMEVIDSPISRYICSSGNMSRKEVYFQLRRHGFYPVYLKEYNIVGNPEYTKYLERKKQEEGDFLCPSGVFNKEQIDYLVKKLNRDLALLEVIGIIPNPNCPNENKRFK